MIPELVGNANLSSNNNQINQQQQQLPDQNSNNNIESGQQQQQSNQSQTIYHELPINSHEIKKIDLDNEQTNANAKHYHLQQQLCLQPSSTININSTESTYIENNNINYDRDPDVNFNPINQSIASTSSNSVDNSNTVPDKIECAIDNDNVSDFNESFESLSLATQLETISNVGATRRGSSISKASSRKPQSDIVIRKFQKLDESLLSSTPAPDVKIGQRVAYKEYYGNEFGTIRWIGKLPFFATLSCALSGSLQNIINSILNSPINLIKNVLFHLRLGRLIMIKFQISYVLRSVKYCLNFLYH